MSNSNTNYIAADGLNIFYREAGSRDAPVILLLHGFPSSSHQYRNLIPLLSQKYHVVAPDLPGFGFTEVPENRKYQYTFDNIATSIEAFLGALKIQKFSVYVFDYGAPTGYRLALSPNLQVQSIISQNGNAYDEGLGKDFWAPFQKYWSSGSNEDREIIRGAALTLEATKWQYEYGSKKNVAPEAPYLDFALLSRPGNAEIQLDIFYDYQSNVKSYPQWHEYFKSSQIPLLAAWGKNDVIFVPEGAEAFKRDLPNAEVHFLDAGHFAVETNTEEIASLILEFLGKNGI